MSEALVPKCHTDISALDSTYTEDQTQRIHKGIEWPTREYQRIPVTLNLTQAACTELHLALEANFNHGTYTTSGCSAQCIPCSTASRGH